MLNEIRKEKIRLVRELQEMVKPHLWESGFLVPFANPPQPMWLWAPKGEDGHYGTMSVNGITLEEFGGFVADGIITKASLGGVQTKRFMELPIEDLYAIHTKVALVFAAFNKVPMLAFTYGDGKAA